MGGQNCEHPSNWLDDPEPFVKPLFKTYPEACHQLLAAEDKKYFLSIARRPGQKPVPFIAVLDANFELWFKKVWQ
jgi:fatty acid synthase subunit alpha